MPSELSFSGGPCDGHIHPWGDDRPPHHHPGVCSPGEALMIWSVPAKGRQRPASSTRGLYQWVGYGGGRDCGRHGDGDVDFQRDPTCRSASRSTECMSSRTRTRRIPTGATTHTPMSTTRRRIETFAAPSNCPDERGERGDGRVRIERSDHRSSSWRSGALCRRSCGPV
jgi:hypothetical protein